MQYKAGYFFNSIFDLFLNQSVKEKVEKIIFQLSHFDLETSDDLTPRQVIYSSEIKTINNLIIKGTPTIPSTYIEELFAANFGNTKKEISTASDICYPFIDDSLADSIYRAIHIIDPRINKSNQESTISENSPGREANRTKLLYSIFADYLNECYIQLIEENRNFESIVKSGGYESNEVLKKYGSILKEKNEFVLEMPYEFNRSRGICFEFIDSPLESKFKFEIEQLKKSLCEDVAWTEQFIIDTNKLSESNTVLRPLLNFTYNEYFDLLTRNYRNPIYTTSSGNKAMQYALTPILVARVQKTIIEYLLSGKLSLDDKTWKIGVIERDLPGTAIALKDLLMQFENLFALKGKTINLPEIKLSTYITNEFEGAKLNQIEETPVKTIDKFDENVEFDLLLDISMLQRKGIKNQEIKSRSRNKAIIRSIRSINSEKNFLYDKNIDYIDIASKKTNDKTLKIFQAALKYFFRNTFRKDNFLKGQPELINSCLQKKNVLGNLPVAGGKTLSFQFASIMQPGLTIVVTPETGSAERQINDLKGIGIDGAIVLSSLHFQNTNLSFVLNKIKNRSFQILYITPEIIRFTEFRNFLLYISDNDIFINNFVIEEADCLSEWSHNFNPFYHKLGELKDSFIKNKDKQKVSSIALSATITNQGQNDILTELIIEPEDVIRIARQTTSVNFQVIDVQEIIPDQENSLDNMKEIIGEKSQIRTSFLIKEIFPEERDRNNENKTLIICPEEYGKNGISDKNSNGVADNLKNNFSKLKIGKYWGTDNYNQKGIFLSEIEESIVNQLKFHNDTLNILVSTQSVSTGLCEPAIRNLILYSPPASIEDFIYQVQRIGWNQNNTNCYILINKQKLTNENRRWFPEYIGTTDLSISSIFGIEKIARNYKGKDKELLIINDLLLSKNSEKTTYLELIKDKIESSFDIEVEFVFHPKSKPVKLYLSCDSKNIGYLDLTNFNENTNESDLDKSYSLKILQFLANEIRKYCTSPEFCHQFLSKEVETEITSISEALEQMKVGTVKEVEVSFANNSLNELTTFLQKEFGKIFSRNKVRWMYESSNSGVHFIEKTILITRIDKGSWHEEKILNLFNNIRQKGDSILALYRLCKLGIIEDYIIDELNRKFIVKIKKKGTESYIINLQNIFESNLLAETASEKIKGIKSVNGKDLFNSIIEVYIDFCYKYLVTEKIKSVEILDKILLQISDNKENRSNFNLWIQELISNYYGAKYINRFFGIIKANPKLKEEVQYFEIIKATLDQMGVINENWQQLRKSIEIVSKILPNNPLPYFFDAYIKLVNEKTNFEASDLALDQIARGFIRMRRQSSFKQENYKENIQILMNHLYQFRPELKEKYDQVLWLRMHYIWLKDFNKTEENG